jgi:hypothetical protein
LVRLGSSVQGASVSPAFSLSENPDKDLILIVGIGLAHEVNRQLSLTFGKNMKLYTFGDMPGSFQLVCLTSPAVCAPNLGEAQNGLVGALAYYEKNRLSNRRDALTLTLGSGPSTRSYLVMLRGFQMGIRDPDTKIAQVTYSFDLAPPAGRDSS